MPVEGWVVSASLELNYPTTAVVSVSDSLSDSIPDPHSEFRSEDSLPDIPAYSIERYTYILGLDRIRYCRYRTLIRI